MNMNIRKAEAEDVAYIAEHMTEEARREIRKLGESDEAEALRQSAAWSDFCNVLTADEEPIMVYGVAGSLIGLPKVWAIGTDKCRECKMFMVRTGRDVIRVLKDFYGGLENWCDADYASSIRWLKLIGFEVDSPERGFCHLHTEV